MDSQTHTETKSLLLDRLRANAYRRGTFRLASGRESDFFIDCKRVVLTAYGHYLAGVTLFLELQDLARAHGLEYVAGVELGGCPLASAVATISSINGLPLGALYVRKAPKDHGTGATVEGLGPDGPGRSRVVLLEDVVTTGGSSIRAVEALRDAGCTVVGVVALVDRLEGAGAAFTAAGVPFRALFTRDDFVGGGP